MLKQLRSRKRGQSTAEYAILIAMVVAGTIAMQTYAKRALQARTFDAGGYLVRETSALGSTSQHEPGYLESSFTVTREQDTQSRQGLNAVSSNSTADIIRATGGFQRQSYGDTPAPPPGGGETCFLANTPVSMADGSQKMIQKIKVGDSVLSFDQGSGQFKPGKVTKVFKEVALDYLVVNETLKLTPNHPVLSNGQWMEVGKLKAGDSLVDKDNKAIVIDTITAVKKKVKVYNIEVDMYHSYVAGGYIAHNKEDPPPPPPPMD